MANLHDINNLFDATTAILYTQTTEEGQFDPISHSAIVSKDGETMMSYGPEGDSSLQKSQTPTTKLGFALKFRTSSSTYSTHKDEAINSGEILLNRKMFSALRSFSEHFPYQGLTSNCVNWASIGLWLNGIPNIGLHPFLLHGSMVIYNSGAYMIIASQPHYNDV